MKNLVMEANHLQDVPTGLIQILGSRFTENREYWMNFKEASNLKNKSATVERMFELPTGTNLIFAPHFEEIDLMHFFVALLYSMMRLKRKLNLYAYHPNLRAVLDRYLLIDKEEIMNERLIKAVNYHNVFQLSDNGNDELIKFNHIETFLTEEAVRPNVRITTVAARTNTPGFPYTLHQNRFGGQNAPERIAPLHLTRERMHAFN